MKYFLISIVLGFIFTGCSDDNPLVKSTLIEDIGELAVFEDKIEFVIQRKVKGIGWSLKKIKGAWIIKGDATLSTNLKNATIHHNEETKTIDILLDKPHVTQAGIDHKRTKIDEVIKGFFTNNDDASEFRDGLMKEAQERLFKIANSPDKILLAKKRTEKVINSHYTKIGWHTKISWRD